MNSSQEEKQQLRIFLWIVPRSCSTVFSKCMTFVDDLQVWMEPYMACNFNDSLYNPNFRKDNPNHRLLLDKLKKVEATEEVKAMRKKIEKIIAKSPGIIDQKEISWSWVKKQLETEDPGKKFIFIKDQSGVMFDRLEFLPAVPSRHTFLIRHPREVYASWRVMIRDRLQMSNEECDQRRFAYLSAPLPPHDSFYRHYELWKHFGEKSGEEPIVIDANDLLTKPDVILPKYFEKVGIPFKESYLQWDSNADATLRWKGSADFVLLEPHTIIYARATKSEKFDHPQRERGAQLEPEWELTPEILEYIDDALPYYEEMYQHRLC